MEIPKIPDEWLFEAGVENYKTNQSNYSYSRDKSEFLIKIISINDLQLPQRNIGVDNFCKDRMLKILLQIKNNSSQKPIEIHYPPNQEKAEIRDGFHRFYASRQLGFTHIPVEITPYFNIRTG